MSSYRKFNFVAQKKFSAAAGRQEYSFASRLSTYTNRTVKLINVALLAGSYQQGKRQLNRLARKLGKRKPDYILVNFTVMDALFGEAPEEFQSYVQNFFQTLTRRYPGSTILITPITDVTGLLTMPDRISVPAFLGYAEFSCSSIRQQGYAAFSSITETSPIEEVLALKLRIAQMNQTLEAELSKIDSRTYPYKTFHGNASLTHSFLPEENEDWGDYLAADCVHPNLRGQEMIGNSFWDAYLKLLPSSPALKDSLSKNLNE